MGWLTKLLSVSWLPYALIGGAAAVGIVFGWGYMKGYSKAEVKYERAVNKALEKQMLQLVVTHKRDLQIQLAAVKDEQEIIHATNQLKFPEIDPVCHDALNDWMRAFNDGVRATAASAGGAN